VNAEIKADRDALHAAADAEWARMKAEVTLRPPGMYWVVLNEGDEPAAAEWTFCCNWYFPGSERDWQTGEFFKVYDTRIEPPELVE
jgi:hypothetical protein